MIEAELRRDDLPDGGRIVTVNQRGDRRVSRNPFLTRIEGGPFDGDRWRSGTRADALRCHAETLSIHARLHR